MAKLKFPIEWIDPVKLSVSVDRPLIAGKHTRWHWNWNDREVIRSLLKSLGITAEGVDI